MAGRVDRLQSNTRFKIIATALIVVVAVVSYSIWLAASSGESSALLSTPSQTVSPESQQSQQAPGAAPVLAPRLTVNEIRAKLRTNGAWVVAGTVALGASLITIVLVWLGLALTSIGLVLAATLVAGPLYLWEPTHGLGRLLIGALALTASFSVVVQALRAVLSMELPSIAIARNVLDEAVRMKVGLVFIIALIFLLSALPGLLDESQLLRYRVQSFLQYSTTGAFWVLALMTLFFSASTVAFEQRDRVITQTMVKPVTPASYLFGKWLGVMTLNLALLSVSASGVFLFTEYLRDQPARGELKPFVLVDGRPGLTRDRELLETQVLTAQAGAPVDPPKIDDKRVEEMVRERLDQAFQRDYTLRGDAQRTAQFRHDVREEIRKGAKQQYMAVPPRGQQDYSFSGLGAARGIDRPLIVRYKVNAGSNEPGDLYHLVFLTQTSIVNQRAPLAITQTFTLSPEDINDDGVLVMSVVNGDPRTGATNPLTISFPPDGFEVLYTAGSYESNFVRVAATLWLKLGFIAAVGIAASTFLSFPVACMLTLLVLFAAESSTFLRLSLEEYPLHKTNGSLDWVAVVMNLIARPIASAFATYGELKPTAKLVTGRLIAWGSLAHGVITIGAWTVASLGIGWAIFRKRELAIYSGQ